MIAPEQQREFAVIEAFASLALSLENEGSDFGRKQGFQVLDS